MEDRRSDLKLGPRSRRESGEASAAGGKGKKNRTPSLVLGNDEREAATGTDITRAWTGEKKTKIQNTPTSEDIGKDAKDDAEHSSAMVVQEQEQEPEQIEGLDWDQDKLNKKIDYFLKQLNGDIADNDDDDFWVLCDDNQRRELNERLALCRIRAHEVEHRELDDSDLKSIYPANVLEDQCYYEFYERDFDWYFDPQYCKYVHLEDYQRLMLRNNGEYEGWEDYREICSTHEGDKDFVELWEKLLSNTKLIEFFLTDSSYKPLKIEKVVFYHWLKIAARLSHVFNALIHSGFHEFVLSVRFDNTWYKYYTGLFVDIWKRVAKQKMNFKEALKEVYDEEKYTVCRFEWKHEFESNGLNPGPMECLYNRHLGHIDEKAEEGRAYQLIMEAVKKFVPKQKTYYDYAKKKLAIAKEIRLTRDPYKRVIGHKAGLAGGYYQVKDRKLLAIEVGV